ncbi:tRNA (adenosine(37)-N6)-dimethylallyltransferase MiaA [Fodinicurvata sp. EGI_FJ10296]|uniref:tRNA (adenosine(37)-N6)-dimethylallyltransferase MiaA n=1 Tax=Fodinicurvata sp. EGI_FJ10296 TaxID=3231908 RepID=UPI0034554DBD
MIEHNDTGTGRGYDQSRAGGSGEAALPVFVIGGPTASGKSALAVDLAEATDGIVINADSMQLYADLNVLTARPSIAELDRVPHRLYGVLDGNERSSVAHWRDAAEREIRAALACGRVPVVVGGTGLYLKSLMQGLSPVPPSDPSKRARAEALHHELGAEGFHADLAARDPEMAARLPAGDTQRCVRAWEVITATGRSLADWQRLPPSGAPSGMMFRPITLMPDRAVVYRACEERFLRMVDSGAVEEVRRLRARNLANDLPVMKAVGVPELSAFIEGRIPLHEAVERASTATRRYAKRQMTWFRHQMGGGKWVAPPNLSDDPPEDPHFDPAGGMKVPVCTQYSKRLAPEILSLIRFSR